MKTETLRRAVEMAKKGSIFMVTADAAGMPHLAAAGTLNQTDESHVEVTDWFCPGSVANMRENQGVSIVVYEPGKDFGYQLVGKALNVEELGVLDGYSPEMEGREPLPQVLWRVKIEVDKIMAFKRAPHTDREE